MLVDSPILNSPLKSPRRLGIRRGTAGLEETFLPHRLYDKGRIWSLDLGSKFGGRLREKEDKR